MREEARELFPLLENVARELNYLRLFEFLVIICLQFYKWAKDVLILISILIPARIKEEPIISCT